jgi:IS5 family transposase
MKTQIGAGTESGLVHMVTGTAPNDHDITLAHALLHGEETVLLAGPSFRGVTRLQKIQEQHTSLDCQVVMMPGEHWALKKGKTVLALIDKLEMFKGCIRAKLQRPFRLTMYKFGCRKSRYPSLVKNKAQLITMFALSKLWMVINRKIQGPALSVRLQRG